jgi:hypothetical protein
MGAGSGSQIPAASGFNQNVVINGLNNFSVTVPYAGPYVVKGKVTIPTLVNGAGASGLIVTLKQNGTTIFTGLTGAEGFKALASCAAYDVLEVLVSSSNSDDSSLTVKSVFDFSQGVA